MAGSAAKELPVPHADFFRAAAVSDGTLFLNDAKVVLDVERSEPDRFERERTEFFRRVRDSYLSRAAADPERCRVVAADQPIDIVASTVLESVAGWLQ